MSIATLKKKTESTYKIMSSGVPQFSLNGTLRNQGYVGQTSLSRSLPKTLMKGNVACGHGGSCGNYYNAPIVQSAVTSLNDANVVKPSVITNAGMLETKYRWVTRPQPYAVVKPDSNSHFTESDYTTYLKQKTIDKINQCNYKIVNGKSVLITKNTMNPACISGKTNNQLFRSDLFPNKVQTLNQTVKNYKYLEHGYTDDYYNTFISKCNTADEIFKPTNTSNAPIVNRR